MNEINYLIGQLLATKYGRKQLVSLCYETAGILEKLQNKLVDTEKICEEQAYTIIGMETKIEELKKEVRLFQCGLEHQVYEERLTKEIRKIGKEWDADSLRLVKRILKLKNELKEVKNEKST